MPYYKHQDLDRFLKRQENGCSEMFVLTCLSEIASALSFAHERSILHRDVKPANIFIDTIDKELDLQDGNIKFILGKKFLMKEKLTRNR